jgi:hypothetical protein
VGREKEKSNQESEGKGFGVGGALPWMEKTAENKKKPAAARVWKKRTRKKR